MAALSQPDAGFTAVTSKESIDTWVGQQFFTWGTGALLFGGTNVLSAAFCLIYV